MFYLRFTNLKEYLNHLIGQYAAVSSPHSAFDDAHEETMCNKFWSEIIDIGKGRFEFNGPLYTHFEIADLSTPRGDIIYAAVATQRIKDTLVVCNEIIFEEPAEFAASRQGRGIKAHLKKIERAIWLKFNALEQSIKDAGVEPKRGILTTEPPEVLTRAK